MELRPSAAVRMSAADSGLTDAEARLLLREGEIAPIASIPWSSNSTHLARISDSGDERDSGDTSAAREMLAVYKPTAGERPLWDFPAGSLARREVAAFEVSEALGWQIVPDTSLRDGPLGEGMVQRFVDHDPGEHYFTLLYDHADRLLRFAVFDVIVNNADRKGGHVLRGADGHLWGIDHGLTFHSDWKLRTVIWDFASLPLGGEIGDDLRNLLDLLDGVLGHRLAVLLSEREADALRSRVVHLGRTGVLPEPDADHYSFPWPLV